MSSEKASSLKKLGHIDEHIFASMIRGNVIKGQGKIDVEDNYGKTYSVKGGRNIAGKKGDGRWQLFLYSKSKFEGESSYPARALIIDILNTFPSDWNDYEENKVEVKNRKKKHMVKLKDFLSVKKNTYDFLNKSIFDSKIDFLSVFHEEQFHIFSREDTLKVLTSVFELKNSKGEQKVRFDYGGKIAVEIEVRTTNDGKYPSLLLVTNKNKIMNILLSSISEKSILQDDLIVYGSANKQFKL